MPGIALIADDLTGAMDSGLQFGKRGLPTLVAMSPERLPDAEVLVVDTDTREARATEAYRRVGEVARALAGRRLYKKVDSTMRGNVGYECRALLEALRPRAIVVAPAFPQGGRTTRDGIQRVDGKPLELTPFAHDPRWPMRQSHMPTLLLQQAGREVGHVPLQEVERGPEALAAALEARPEPLIVADALEDHGMPLIVDPVMVAGVGDSLAEKDLHRALKKELLPMCELVTPNRHEAEILSGIRIDTPDDAMLACELIGKEGTSVLLKGGHMNTRTVVDYLYLSSEFTKMENPRLERAGHGGGCTLSSYITAHMAKGIDIVNSVLRSRDLMQNSIASMYSVGRGDKVVNPIVRMNDESVRFRILDSVDAAARRIMDNVPDIWVPSSGINIAYAAPNAAGPEDIAAIERRIVNHNGRLRKNGSAKFGSAESLSFVLLTVMKSHQETRAVMSLAFREEILDIMEEVGLSAVSLSRKNGIAEATAEALRGVNTLPDVLVDREAPRNDRFIRILGRDPEDIMGKLESIL